MAINHTQNKNAEKEVATIVYIEPSSQISERDYFLEQFGRELDKMAYLKPPLTVIIIELSHLKKQNQIQAIFLDDFRLRKFGNLVRKNIKQTDLFGRLSNEEFAVALLETDMETAVMIAENLKRAMGYMNLFIEGKESKITASFGIAVCLPQKEAYDNLINVQVLGS